MSTGWQIAIGAVALAIFYLLFCHSASELLINWQKWKRIWPQDAISPEEQQRGRTRFWVYFSIVSVMVFAGMAICANVIDATTTVTP